MQETPQQYTQRMLNHSQGKDPLRLQQAAPRKFAALTKGLEQEAADPAPGGRESGPSPKSSPTWRTRSWSSAIAFV